jgi:hypothetical protein
VDGSVVDGSVVVQCGQRDHGRCGNRVLDPIAPVTDNFIGAALAVVRFTR